MSRFGVGRPAVREAMQTMHVMGLITISHGGRARANELSTDTVIRSMDDVGRLLLSTSPDDLEHLKEARRMFEVGMVRAAAVRATRAGCAALRALLDRQSGHIGDATQLVYADMAFHIGIAKISANLIFVGVSETMLGWLFTYHSDLLRWRGNEGTTLSEHESILATLIDRDADQAVSAMRIHLDRSNDLYQNVPKDADR